MNHKRMMDRHKPHPQPCLVLQLGLTELQEVFNVLSRDSVASQETFMEGLIKYNVSLISGVELGPQQALLYYRQLFTLLLEEKHLYKLSHQSMPAKYKPNKRYTVVNNNTAGPSIEDSDPEEEEEFKHNKTEGMTNTKTQFKCIQTLNFFEFCGLYENSLILKAIVDNLFSNMKKGEDKSAFYRNKKSVIDTYIDLKQVEASTNDEEEYPEIEIVNEEVDLDELEDTIPENIVDSFAEVSRPNNSVVQNIKAKTYLTEGAFFRTNRKRSPSPPGPIKALMKSADSRIDQRFSGVRNPTILEPSMKEYIDQIIDDNKTSTQAHTHIKKMAKSDNMNCLIF